MDEMLGMAAHAWQRPVRAAVIDTGTARCIAAAVTVWRLGRATLDLPRGTGTLLFTDAEGSTRLLTAPGDDYADVLAAHHRVFRDAIHAHDGREVGTHGDAFFVAFARTRDAMGAALAAHRGLAAGPWPDGVRLRVRMGLHRGEPTVRGTTYVGLDVHRAARICFGAHGGQVLLSRATSELVARSRK